MEEVVKIIPILMIAVIFEPAIILFIILPPLIFGFGFGFIEWASTSFSLNKFADIFQMSLYTSFTALISESVPLLFTSVSLVFARRYYYPSSWQIFILALIFEGLYSALHLHFFDGHSSDIAVMTTLASGIGAYILDKHQKTKGVVPMPPQKLYIASDAPVDFETLKIETDRLDLVSLNDSYADEIFRYFTPEVTRYMSTKAPMIPAESEEFVKHSLKRIQKGEEIIWAIHDAHTGNFLGLCEIDAHTDADHPKLGIWLREDMQGYGYGKEAIDAIVEWASKYLVFEYLQYIVSEHNIPSRKIAESIGGLPVGTKLVKISNNSDAKMIIYALNRKLPDPSITFANLIIWTPKHTDTQELLYSPLYRLKKTKDIHPANSEKVYDSYEIHGKNLFLANQRIPQRPKHWIEAGSKIQELIKRPDHKLIYCNLDAALALSLSHINQSVNDLLSVELISAVSLDPSDPGVLNSTDPIATTLEISAIPNNYYVIIFNINGRYKYIHHIRSNAQFVFEDMHTMGSNNMTQKQLAISAQLPK